MTPNLISKLRLQLFLALALVSTNIVAIAANSAAIVLYGKSVQLLPSTPANVSGYVNVVTYFSTFNGTSGGILVDSTNNKVYACDSSGNQTGEVTGGGIQFPAQASF